MRPGVAVPRAHLSVTIDGLARARVPRGLQPTKFPLLFSRIWLTWLLAREPPA